MVPKPDLSCLFSSRAETDTPDVCPVDGRQTHRARFEVGVKHSTGQVVIPDMVTRIPDGIDFRMGGGIVGFQHGIVSFPQELTVPDNNRPERPSLPVSDGMECLFNGHFQIKLSLRHSGKLLK
jgi:hypothetical protein